MSETPRIKHNYGKINKEYAMFLATRPPEEDGPIYMVNLMKYHEVAQYEEDAGVDKAISGREADDRYNPAKVLNKIGADIVFAGDVLKNHVGTEDWDRIAVVRYATRKSFIDMQSRPDFARGTSTRPLACCARSLFVVDQKMQRLTTMVAQTDHFQKLWSWLFAKLQIVLLRTQSFPVQLITTQRAPSLAMNAFGTQCSS